MDELKNLQVMASRASGRFNAYKGEDFILPEVFRKSVTEINNSRIYYNKYSAILETKGNQYGVLNIFLPNQWFYIASYFTEFYNELQRYRKIALSICEKERLKTLNKGNLSLVEKNKLLRLGLSETSQQYVEKFITDYEWWGGAKTVDRADFYVSPILSYARLVNASQSFVADLCAFLADKQELVDCIINSLETAASSSIPVNLPLQQIFYGAPGTGKSHGIQKAEDDFAEVIRTTFHPDSDYSTFVGCYKPTKVKTDEKPLLNFSELANKLKEYRTKDTETNAQVKFGYDYYQSLRKVENLGQLLLASGGAEYDTYLSAGMLIAKQDEGARNAGTITYDFTPQAFTQAYVNAWKLYAENKAVLLVIEEINRGNCAQIFGDLFQLLDRRADGFSSYPIVPDTDLQRFVAAQCISVNGVKDARGNDISTEICNGTNLLLPPNLYIWATMNTSDQSLFPIDSAFKRRWDWKYVPIDTEKENWAIAVGGKKYSWTSFLDIINNRIFDTTTSEDKQLGFFFCKAQEGIITAERFVSKVLFFIYNDVYKDYGFNDDCFNDEKGKLTFRKYYTSTGSINEDKVERFLQNLKVEDYVEETEDEEDGVAPNGTSHMHLKSVTFEDGTKFSSDDLTRPEIYIKSLAKIGLERVEPVLNTDPLPFHRCKCPIVSKTQYDAVLNSTNKYFEQDGYFIISSIMDDTKIKVLQLLDEKYSLNLQIEWY